jgi:selenocysteine lyase/cysteine desulfurase
MHGALENSYSTAAGFFNARPDEIAFVENATRAWDMAFYSIPFKEGDRVLTAQSEYVSNYLAYLQVQKRCGIRVEVIPNDEHGQVSVAALANMLDNDVRLISITHIPTSGGLVNPAAEIGRLAREANVLYLLDACQSAGQLPLDVEALGCHMLSGTGRKFLRGPRGTGFLYVRRSVLETLEPPFVDLHAATWTAVDEYELRGDARRFENWETNFAGKLALSRAFDYATNIGMDAIWAEVRRLGAELRSRLGGIDGIHLADDGQTLCGIVTFHVDGMDPEDIVTSLRQSGINLSSVDLPSARLDMEARGLPPLVRASVHYYNTLDELDRAASALEDLTR